MTSLYWGWMWGGKVTKEGNERAIEQTYQAGSAIALNTF